MDEVALCTFILTCRIVLDVSIEMFLKGLIDERLLLSTSNIGDPVMFANSIYIPDRFPNTVVLYLIF